MHISHAKCRIIREQAKCFRQGTNSAIIIRIVLQSDAKVSRLCDMKRIYSRLRIGMMTFALGLAVVYMINGLSIVWSEVQVELPSAKSANILVVFTDTSRILTREKNCGRDPRDTQARIDCANERLFGTRDMSLYAQHEIICDSSKSDNYLSVCGFGEERRKRNLVWRHWREKARAHLIVYYVGAGWKSEAHYFIEPYDNGRWQLVSRDKTFRTLIVDDQETEVAIIDDYPWSYRRARWRVATEDEGPCDTPPGTRYLEFENETGDTVSF